MGGYTLKVPKELINPLFFPDGEIEWMESYSSTFQHKIPFIHEAGFYAKIAGLKPWEEPEVFIPFLLSEWQKLKIELESLFARREFSSSLKLMKRVIAIYLEFLYWSNNKPVSFPLKAIETFEVKPLNIQDRIQFILSRPNLYHSFIQLSELINEQEKQFSKSFLIKRNSPIKNVRE